jgi:hypothetical protein
MSQAVITARAVNRHIVRASVVSFAATSVTVIVT